jgi:hypothetical protein
MKRFDRYTEMTQFKLDEISNFKRDLFSVDTEDREEIRQLENSVCGLYDGYFYITNLTAGVKMLRDKGYKGLSIRLGYIISDVSKYKFIKTA